MAAANTTSFLSVIGGGNALVADNSSNFGMNGFMANVGSSNGNSVNAVAIGSSTTPTLTAAQFVSRIWDISGSPGGGVTLTTPTAAQIIAALPPTIPKNGTFNFQVKCLNDALAQTITVTAGSGVTVVGTATVTTNTVREFMVNVNVSAGTVTMLNLGSVSL
jgi:hypothetical protein